MTIDDVFDLLDHAIEPEPWLCDEQWEYRAMHWRYREEPTGEEPLDEQSNAEVSDAQTV